MKKHLFISKSKNKNQSEYLTVHFPIFIHKTSFVTPKNTYQEIKMH